MTLQLTPEVLRAAYAYLDKTAPFSKWNLPDADDVIFRVCRDRRVAGWYNREGRKHAVFISSACVGHTASLMELMAHEMIHVHEAHSRACSPGAEHSAAFRKWAAQVCRVHGFDLKTF